MSRDTIKMIIEHESEHSKSCAYQFLSLLCEGISQRSLISVVDTEVADISCHAIISPLKIFSSLTHILALNPRADNVITVQNVGNQP